MASDDARLLVRIEAQMRQFERAMAKASGTSDRAARRIERRWQGVQRNLDRAGRGVAQSLLAPLLALASGQAAARAADSYTRIENALKVAGLEGEALTATFEKLFASAQRWGAPIEALVDVYRAGALAQKELNVTSEELIGFTEGISAALRVSGKSAEESRGALIQLAQAIGSGVVRAEEFNAILEGALPIAQAAARGLEEAGGSVAKLRTLIIDGKVSSEAFFRAFEAGSEALKQQAAETDSTIDQAYTRLQNTFTSVIGKMNEAYGTTGLLEGGIDDVGQALEGLADWLIAVQQPLADLDSWFRTLQNSAFDFGRALGDLTGLSSVGEMIGLGGDEAAERINQAITTANAARLDVDLDAALRRKVAEAGGELVAGGEPEPIETVSVNDFAPPAGTKKGGGRSKKTPAETFDQDIAAIERRTAALRMEAEVIGLGTYEAEKARQVFDLLEEAKAANVAITPELTARIEAQADAYARATVVLEEMEAAQQAVEELQQFIGESLTGFFSDIISGSATAEDSLKRLVQTLADAALQAALLGQGPLAGLFGTTGASGGVGGLFGALFKGFGGAFASGGTLGAGKWGIAGEAGPEIIHGPARITPAANANASNVHVTVGVDLDRSGNLVPFVTSISDRRASAQLKSYDRNVQASLNSRAARNIR